MHPKLLLRTSGSASTDLIPRRRRRSQSLFSSIVPFPRCSQPPCPVLLCSRVSPATQYLPLSRASVIAPKSLRQSLTPTSCKRKVSCLETKVLLVFQISEKNCPLIPLFLPPSLNKVQTKNISVLTLLSSSAWLLQIHHSLSRKRIIVPTCWR